MTTNKQLINKWNQMGRGALSRDSFVCSLSVKDTERLKLLKQRYPRMTEEQLLQDLLQVALDSFEASMPYVKGTQVIAFDEEGDALYEDIGETPRFLALTQKHRKQLMREVIDLKK